jgi:uncharacterized protein DUF262/HNH endonuclease
MSSTISCEFGTRTILDLRSLQENGNLNLEPGFQRKSVWAQTDRRRFIASVLEGYPVPSIFLYKREENGLPIYDVLDGKQRLETVFMFSRVSPFRRQGFSLKHQFEQDDEAYHWDWKGLEKWSLTSDFLTYKFQVAEVSGDLSDIVDLFVRINSTGKSLSSSEKRHAKFYKSPFLKESKRLAKRHNKFLIENGIMRPAAIERMKDVELVSELVASIIADGPIHKKQAVDKAVGDVRVHAKTLSKAVGDFSATLKAIKRVFPDLASTRLSNQAEFYTLFLVVHEMLKQKLLLTDRKRNKTAMKILSDFSDGVDAVRERQRFAQGAKASERMFADYLLLVQQSTDALGPRKRRMEIVRHLLNGIFESKDERRVFSVEQRRLLWNSDEQKKCGSCGERLDWINFQVDHVTPYSKGGKTKLSNAALLCASCNASKGAGRTRTKVQKKRRRVAADNFEGKVRSYVSKHGSITPSECRKISKMGDSASAKTRTSQFLKKCTGRSGFLRREGKGSNTVYYPR